uniref:Uncharacterized protein n=1 Tax=Chromera velia CCMP2878 TaxID=1169474 RepID=A0A0G4G635_9ALVE|eukprot:Cvel_20394.t1-p1 / transcript=Cvel_20394.t1 / gene=Cvel_20394 / organism=Chromera_velia_CCMP2878 / gene_product=hypothetical protein / transcript_product=hypothetical protein / location=Cvel_scaffold1826:4529-4765(-) / protein_length=79 / sequence_SO=supercontig / SO=protein_coding / is_pseudo=false
MTVAGIEGEGGGGNGALRNRGSKRLQVFGLADSDLILLQFEINTRSAHFALIGGMGLFDGEGSLACDLGNKGQRRDGDA